MTYQTIKLGADGDLDVQGGRLSWLQGARAVAQRLEKRLQVHLDEWFLEQGQGMPYRTQIFVKNPDLQAIGSIFRREILAVPEIIRVEGLALGLDTFTRELTVTFTAYTNEAIIEAEGQLPIAGGALFSLLYRVLPGIISGGGII